MPLVPTKTSRVPFAPLPCRVKRTVAGLRRSRPSGCSCTPVSRPLRVLALESLVTSFALTSVSCSIAPAGKRTVTFVPLRAFSEIEPPAATVIWALAALPATVTLVLIGPRFADAGAAVRPVATSSTTRVLPNMSAPVRGWWRKHRSAAELDPSAAGPIDGQL